MVDYQTHSKTVVPDHPDKVQVGHYYLEKTIGQGTYGKVKLGRNIITLEKVFILVIQGCNQNNL